MKTLAPALLAVALTAAAVSAQQPAPPESAQPAQPSGMKVDITAFATWYVPAQDDDYDYGIGFDAQARFWLTPYVGLAVGGGSAGWQINEKDETIVVGPFTGSAEMEGTVGLTSMGGSLLLRPVNSAGFALTLEAGARYMAVNSDADIELEARDAADNRFHVKDTIDIEDGVVGVLAAQAELKLGGRLSLLAGAGWQFDLIKGDVEWNDEDMGENKLEALFFQGGLGLRF